LIDPKTWFSLSAERLLGCRSARRLAVVSRFEFRPQNAPVNPVVFRVAIETFRKPLASTFSEETITPAATVDRRDGRAAASDGTVR